jgi:hypothetical protein
MLLESFRIAETGAIVCFVVEYTGKDSTIAKYEISSEFVGGLRHMAKAEF